MTDRPPPEPLSSAANQGVLAEFDLGEDDILEAMREIPGYLDITTADFRALYRLAQRHALDRLFSGITAARLMRRDVLPLAPEISGSLQEPTSGSPSARSTPRPCWSSARSAAPWPSRAISSAGTCSPPCWQWLGSAPWLAQALAVATAIALMHLTRTPHPPGGANALIAVIGSDQVHTMGYLFVLLPATLGPLVLLAVALLVNNLIASRRYPEFWL